MRFFFQSYVEERQTKKTKDMYVWTGWQRGPVLYTIFSQLEAKFISVQNLISKPSITLLSRMTQEHLFVFQKQTKDF